MLSRLLTPRVGGGLLLMTIALLATAGCSSVSYPTAEENRRLEHLRQTDRVMYEVERRQKLEDNEHNASSKRK